MKDLTLYEFKLLSDHDQYDMVFNHGQFIDFHIDGATRFALYALFMFFVEIEYDSSSNKVVNKVSFVSGKILNRYTNLKL